MPVYELQIEAKAYDDLKEIVDYLAKHSLEALKKFRDHLDKQLNLLRTMPLIGSNPRDPKLRRRGYRFMILDDYLIFYFIKAQKVQVRRIIHQTRNYFSIL